MGLTMYNPITLAGDSMLQGRIDATGLDTDAVADALGLPPEQRCARSGSTAAQWAAPGSQLLAKAIAAPRGVCVLSLLANDAFAALPGGISEAEAFAAISAYGYVTRRLMERHELLVACLYQDPYFGTNPDIAAGVARVDAALVAAIPPGAAVIDWRNYLGRECYDGDGVHPNLRGYSVMADVLSAFTTR